MISPDQLRAARAMLNWSQAELARRVGAYDTIIRLIEQGQPDEKAMKRIADIERVFNEAGIYFVGDHGISNKPPADAVAVPKSKSKQKGKSNAKAVS